MNKAMNRSFALILLLLFVFSQSYLFAESFKLVVAPAAPLWIAALCVSVWLAGVFRHGIFISLPLSVGLLYGAYRYYAPDVSAELVDVLDKLAGAYYEHFYAPGSVYAFSGVTEHQTMLFIVFAFLIASYMITALTAKSTRIMLSMLGSLPIFFCCIAVNGIPSAMYIVGTLLFWVLVFVSGGGYTPESAAWRSVLVSALPCALLLAAILLIKPPADYSFTDEDVARTRRINKLAALLQGEVVESETGMGDAHGTIIETPEPAEPYTSWKSDGGMSLDNAYTQTAEDTVFLRAKSDSEGYIYLRGSSFGEYTGSGWSAAVEPEQSSSLDFAAHAAAASGGAEHELELRYVTTADAKFMPYYSLSGSPSDIKALYGGGQRQNTIYTTLNTQSASLPDDIVQQEADYRAFAYDYYTRLPDSTRSAMLDIALQNGISAEDGDIISSVADFVRSSAEYDLNVEPFPGDDSAVYFLTQSDRGYCVHFASAAAAMYRALGVPARVTEGFLFYAEAGSWTEVTGANAHAWVEVYRDALGWIPVEVTPSSEDSEGVPGGEMPKESLAPEESAPLDEPESQTTEVPTPTPAVDNGRPSGIISGEPVPIQTQEREAKINWIIIAPMLVVILVLLTILLRRRIILTRSMAKRRGKDNNRAVIELWHVCEKLQKYGIQAPEAVKSCAEKAAFSPHTVSREDVKACRNMTDALIKQSYAHLKPMKKLRFRFIDCVM